jgi:phage gpG-like protein
MGIALRVSFSGMKPIKMKLAKLAEDLENPKVPLMQSAVQITEETLRNFEAGGRPEAWAPLSLMSLFIRAHRADGPKRTESKPLQDTRRLMNSFVPWVGEDGRSFGVSTNVEYARPMQEGGLSEASTIAISGFRRRKSKSAQNQKFFGDTGWTRKSKDYDLHLAGGAPIPARPFFPRNIGELNTWGYQAKIKRIFRGYFGKDL